MEVSIPTLIQLDHRSIHPTEDLSLTALLSKDPETVDIKDTVTLKILEEPKTVWHVRTINCLANKHCSALSGQSGTQRHNIRFEVRSDSSFLSPSVMLPFSGPM